MLVPRRCAAFFSDEFAALVPSNVPIEHNGGDHAHRHSELMSLHRVVQAHGGPDEDPDGGFGHGGWSMPYFDPAAMGPVLDEVLEAMEALLFGRRTWQTMAAAWPARAGDPCADRMNEIRKYVASRTLAQDVVLGGGKRLFPDDGRSRALELVSTSTSSTGVHICTYRPDGNS